MSSIEHAKDVMADQPARIPLSDECVPASPPPDEDLFKIKSRNFE